MKTATLQQLIHIINHEPLEDKYAAVRELQQRKNIRMALIRD
jgi:hypothetical protein